MPSRYDTVVDPSSTNNAHAHMLQLVGYNQRVLELGAAAGHVTRALTDQSCRVTAVEYDEAAAADLKRYAQECIVGDLNDPTTLSGLQPEYDVALAGDVLEHLLNPQQVLDRVALLLRPGGKVVVSLPHIAHVDVRLALLQGKFEYRDWGLLDSTHVRFFTLQSIQQMVQRAGLVITELRRVRVPAFESEVAVERSSVPSGVLEAVLEDPEAETYQFVFSAVKHDGDYEISRLARRSVQMRDELERTAIELVGSQIEMGELLGRVERLESERRADRVARISAESELDSLMRTKTFRYLAGPRRLYSRLRVR